MKTYTIIAGVNGAGKSSLTGVLRTEITNLGKIIDVDKIIAKYNGNMIEGGKTPYLNSKDLENIGYDIVFYPCTSVYTVTKAFRDVLRTLRDEGSTANCRDKMLDFNQFNNFIGLNDYNELDKKYK